MSQTKVDPRKLIKLLGGTVKTAQLWGVTKGAVSQWNANGVPVDFIKFLRVARPDLIKKLGV